MQVAVVGGGISGVTLALRLQQLGVGTTLFVEQAPEQQRVARVACFVARFPATQARERALGVAHWDDVPGGRSEVIRVEVAGTPIGFAGRVGGTVGAVDFRLYLSRLAEDYRDRGGRLVVGPLPASAEEVAERTAGHDVVVVAAGRHSAASAELFPVRRDRSPYAVPQRRLCGGLFVGVTEMEPPGVTYTLVPGVGEVFQQPFLSARGPVAAVLVEAVPGGPLDALTRHDLGDTAGFASRLADHVADLAPAIAARIDRRRFAPTGPADVLSGAVTPVVRRFSARLADGRLALAVGDAWITNDPITGQGANLGSHTAWVAADALATAPSVDAGLADRLEDELWGAYAGPVTAFTNGFLAAPPPHVVDLMAAATADQRVADAFAAGFADPARFARVLSTPEATAAFVAGTASAQVVPA